MIFVVKLIHDHEYQISDAQSLKKALIIFVLHYGLLNLMLFVHVVHQLLNSGVRFRRLADSIYLSELSLSFSRNGDFCFESALDPLPDVLFILGPIYISPYLEHQNQVLNFGGIFVFVPSLFEDPFEQILAISFTKLEGDLAVFDELVENKQSVVVVFGQDDCPHFFIALLCEFFRVHEFDECLDREMNCFLVTFDNVGGQQ